MQTPEARARQIAGLRPVRKGDPSPRKGITGNYQRESDKFRLDMVKAWNECKGTDRLQEIIKGDDLNLVIQAAKLITALLPKQINIDKNESINRMTITANISTKPVEIPKPDATIITDCQQVDTQQPTKQ